MNNLFDEMILPSFDRESTSSPKRCINEPIVRLFNSGLSRPPPNKRKSSIKMNWRRSI
jgi:hypothetical protein